MNQSNIIPHLFRMEYSKMVAVLTRSFGLDQIELAEDIVSETFLEAVDNWTYKGEPANPAAWLYSVAKNKLRNHLLRNKTFNRIAHQQEAEAVDSMEMSIDFSEQHIADSQLQMLFAVCHPAISPEAQICLALRILCGLGLNEIADAFLSNKTIIHKRMQRAKKKLHAEQIALEMPNDVAIDERLNTVLQTIYLLFSEGYYSASNEAIVRKELCAEAINLAYLLLNHPRTNNHPTNALLSLMCFQASRLAARQAGDGSMVLYDDQDRELWDTELIEKGFHYLQRASQWNITSTYYIEASIAYWHTVDNNSPDKWTSILKLYDVLLALTESPVVAMNRIWAFSKVHGCTLAMAEAEKLHLPTNRFYWMLLAELYQSNDEKKTIEYLFAALACCKTNTESTMIQRRIDSMKQTQLT